MTSTETPGTRVSESGPNDGNELPSPLSVAHVTGSPDEGIVMARRTNDEQEPQAQVEETEAPGTELETEAPAEVESTEPEAPAEDEESEDEEGEEDEPAEDVVDMQELENMLAEAAKEQPKPAKELRPYVFTPFQGAKFVTDLLVKAGVTADDGGPKIVNGPQMYIYARNGRFKIRRSPVDIQRVKDGKTKAKPRWEIFPLSTFQAFAVEYVSNQKKGITAAQARKQRQESAAASDQAAEQDLAAALEESLAAVGGGEQPEAE